MKKIFTTLLSAGLVLSMVACSPKSVDTNVETYNDITKTVTKTTQNGKTTTETTYTDKDGNTLDEEEGKKAFEEAKKAAESTAEEVTAEVFHYANSTGQSIKELYMNWQEKDSWGDNQVKDELPTDSELNINGSFAYVPNQDQMKIKIVYADGTEETFEKLVLPALDNSNEITFTFTKDGDKTSVAVTNE